jgi:excisionase family DNA binding protein
MPQTHTPDQSTIEKARAVSMNLPEGELRIDGVAAPLPAAVAAMLREMLTTLAAGAPVALVTPDSEMSPNEAAVFLKCSRGFISKLMDEGLLPFRQVGAHRRISSAAVALYQAKQQAKSHAAMDELVRLNQETATYDDQRPMPSKASYRNPGDRGA